MRRVRETLSAPLKTLSVLSPERPDPPTLYANKREFVLKTIFSYYFSTYRQTVRSAGASFFAFRLPEVYRNGASVRLDRIVSLVSFCS